jgi:hypothetical protein
MVERASYMTFMSIIILTFFAGARLYRARDAPWYTLSAVSASTLFLYCFLLFPVHYFVSVIAMPLYSLEYLTTNSRYLSVNPSEKKLQNHPSITIQIPVYDEDFKKIIRPILRSCVKMRDTYSGLCNIVVNDDGLYKFVDDDELLLTTSIPVVERVNYYKKYGIGYTCRPFTDRPGKFKKAGNMNFGIKCILNDYTDIGTYIRPAGFHDLGEYIVIVDSDSIVPDGILIDTLKLFEQERNLAYTQHCTIPTENSYQNYFSRRIASSTLNLYGITFRISTRNGDITPVVGHNIIMRRAALEELREDDEYWSEDKVSEDFDMCLRLHTADWYGKYVLYEDRPFQEGITLTYEDEMAKYVKFAYGVSETLFNPIKEWCSKSPLTRTFRQFILSDISISTKIGIFGYMMTYFAVGVCVPVAPAIVVAGCYVQDWETVLFDPFYPFITILVLFGILAPAANCAVKKRLGIEVDTKDEFLTGLFYLVFYSGISWPIWCGLTTHLLDSKISWGATTKTLDEVSVPRRWASLLRNRCTQITYGVFLITLCSIIYFKMGCTTFLSLLPIGFLALGHIISPFVLTPELYVRQVFAYDVRDSNEIEAERVYKGFANPFPVC